MSRYDFQTFSPMARRLIYKSFAVTLATNSLKLGLSRIGKTPRPYMWFDPPWLLYKDDRVVLDPSHYPKTPLRRREAERRWLNSGMAFVSRRRSLLSVRKRYDNVVQLRFDSGWLLLVPGIDRERDPDQWYDDWYATGPVQSAA